MTTKQKQTAAAAAVESIPTREMIKLRVAISVFTELVGQMGRANRLQPAMIPDLAKQAINASEVFIEHWKHGDP